MVSTLRSFAAEVNLVFQATFSNARVRIYWGLDSHILGQGEDSWGRNNQQLLFLPSFHPRRSAHIKRQNWFIRACFGAKTLIPLGENKNWVKAAISFH